MQLFYSHVHFVQNDFTSTRIYEQTLSPSSKVSYNNYASLHILQKTDF